MTCLRVKCPVQDRPYGGKQAREGSYRAGCQRDGQPRHCDRSHGMTAIPAPRPGWELLAGQVNQRRYEALRAYLYEGLPLQQAADAAGYTRSALASLVRDLRAGKVTVFAAPGTRAARAPRRRTRPAAGSSGCAAKACRSMRSACGSPGREPRWAAARSATSCATKDSAGWSAARRLRPAPARPPPAATPGCRPPPSSTSVLSPARPYRHGRAAARGPGPGRPGPARPGWRSRLPRHPGHPGRLLAAVPAHAQAHRHPARVPRR